MKLYQKRKDAALAVLFTILIYVIYPFAMLVYLIEQACETIRDEDRCVEGPRRTHESVMAEMRYRRGRRQAKRNNPELDWS